MTNAWDIIGGCIIMAFFCAPILACVGVYIYAAWKLLR